MSHRYVHTGGDGKIPNDVVSSSGTIDVLMTLCYSVCAIGIGVFF
jgi:hypothetical protein